MSQFLYGLIKHFSGMKSRFASLSMFEKEVFKLIDDIQINEKKEDRVFTEDERKMLKSYLVKYCSLAFKKKPKISSDKYTRYRNYLINEQKYYAKKPTFEKFTDKEAFESGLKKWQNLELTMNSKTENQYKKYMKEISEWKDNMDSSQLSEEALKAINKKKDSFLPFRDIVLKFHGLNDRICELTKYWDDYSSTF